MKAKDLMVGIFVYFKCFDGTRITVRVTGFKDNIVYGVSENGSHWCTIEKVEPIPLTLEILEKNEFIGMPYAVLKIDDDSWLEYYYHEHRLIKWWSGIDEWENYSKVKDITFQCYCIYVHELQHALKLCGIEKEIKL